MKKDRKSHLQCPGGTQNIQHTGKIVTDPMGTYTGVPANPYDTPVQDADDL
jgi:hypothetical protein